MFHRLAFKTWRYEEKDNRSQSIIQIWIVLICVYPKSLSLRKSERSFTCYFWDVWDAVAGSKRIKLFV